MPALDAHRLFLSTVTAELGRYRTLLAPRFEAVSVKAVYQEEFEYANTDLVEKLYQLISPCDVVIHFVGAAAGARANPAAVNDFLDRCKERSPDFLGFWKDKYNLDRAFFDALSYTQWEAVIAVFLGKVFMPLVPKGLITDGHPPDKPPFHASAEDAASQKRHLDWLNKTIRRYPQLIEEKDGTYLDDAFHKIIGFLLRNGSGGWQQVAEALQNLPEQKLAPTRLVSRHTSADFLGREKELDLLDKAWVNANTNVFALIAWGGVGKTALLAQWVQSRFTEKGWKNDQGQPDPLRYFDWTFYDQGTRSDDSTRAGVASVDTFFAAALEFFGDTDPSKPGKGKRLAGLVQAQRALLVLDGLEPLQYPFNHPQAGLIIDPDLHDLLLSLAQRNPGLCLVSSRQHISDLSGSVSSTSPQHDLGELPLEVAVLLLRKLGVIGSDDDLAKAARDYAGHALTLTLLGRFLLMARGGDIRQRDTIPLAKANDQRTAQTRNAWHVLEAYEQWCGSPQGRPEDLQALRLTGLFDRPATPDCLAALRATPAIPGLTDLLVPLDRDTWNMLLRRLHDAHLIQLRFPGSGEIPHAPRPEPREVPVDVHPLIREYFSQQLRLRQPDAFRQAHSRLFDHLCASTPHWPDTLVGLQPLYQAVTHGCLAGRHSEARENVYYERILRGYETFSSAKLGSIGADLGAVASFFDEHWIRLSPDLSAPDQAWLLNEAAYCLRALGRLTAAVEPIRESLRISAGLKNWKQAAIRGSNLAELQSALGQLEEAVDGGLLAIRFSDLSEDTFQKMVNRCTAADALHQAGKLDEAVVLFKEAERIQAERQPEYPLLYSMPGFLYTDLLMVQAERAAWKKLTEQEFGGLESETPSQSLGSESNRLSACHEAESRAAIALQIAEQNKWLLDIALDHLTQVRAVLYRALLTGDSFSGLQPSTFSDSLAKLRAANHLDEIPKALLTSAFYHGTLGGDPSEAARLLDEAQQIAERGPMPLYLADVHLHRARLFRERSELQKARVLIEKHGYGRRTEELRDAEAAAVGW